MYYAGIRMPDGRIQMHGFQTVPMREIWFLEKKQEFRRETGFEVTRFHRKMAKIMMTIKTPKGELLPDIIHRSDVLKIFTGKYDEDGYSIYQEKPVFRKPKETYELIEGGAEDKVETSPDGKIVKREKLGKRRNVTKMKKGDKIPVRNTKDEYIVYKTKKSKGLKDLNPLFEVDAEPKDETKTEESKSEEPEKKDDVI